MVDPPIQLLKLNRLEKRLLSKIQVFMTMVILPGGQYAERGLVLNIPVNHKVISDQLKEMRTFSLCSVKFQAGKAEKSNLNHLVRPNIVYDAFHWLHLHNVLYKDQTACVSDLTLPNDNPISKEKTIHDASAITDDQLQILEEGSVIPVDYTYSAASEY